MPLGWYTAPGRLYSLDGTYQPEYQYAYGASGAPLGEWRPTLTEADRDRMSVRAGTEAESRRRALGRFRGRIRPAGPWVTPTQHGELEAIPREEGEWKTWLPGALDDGLPGWQQMEDKERIDGLDTLIPILALPGEVDTEEVSEVVADYTAEVLEPLLAKYPRAADAPEDQLEKVVTAALEASPGWLSQQG